MMKGPNKWYVIVLALLLVATGVDAQKIDSRLTRLVEILDIMQETSFNDRYTTEPEMIPSGNKAQAGFGKIDCLAGLQNILGITAIERIMADESQQVAPAQMNSVDAPVYDARGQQVPKSQKGLVIYKGRKYMNK